MTGDKFFSELEQRLGALPGSRKVIEGATNEEIASVEEYAGHPIPAVYRSFLRVMGRNAGHLFQGSDYSITGQHHLRFRQYAERLLTQRSSTFGLPKSAFVFLMHQGYQFLYIPLDQGDDPPVYLVSEREPYPKMLSDRLTSYLEKYLSDLEQLAITHPHLYGPDDESCVGDRPPAD